MVLPCCVAGCNTPPDNVTYFDFPTSRLLRRRWLDAIKPTHKVHADSKVCSAHFERHDYEMCRGRVRLKGKVVPTLFNIITPTSPKQNSTSTVPEISLIVPEGNIAVTQGTAWATDDKAETCKTNDVKQNNIKEVTQDTSSATNDEAETRKTNEVKQDNIKEIIQDTALQDSSELHSQNGTENITSNKTKNTTEITTKHNIKLEIEVETECKTNEVTGDTDAVTQDTATVVNEVSSSIAVAERTADSQKEDVRHVNDNFTVNNANICTDRLSNDSPTIDMNKDDIEDILTNYHIKQTKPLHKIYTQLEQEREREREFEREIERQREIDANVIEIDEKEDRPPVFIEVAVNQNNARPGGDSDGNDCLMVLESVQVEVDPSMLMLPEPDSGDSDLEIKEDEPDKKADPISLLTSSDEDEVIIQEPHIDTVEVSDETDEDDMPLVKLVKPKKPKKRQSNPKPPNKSDLIAKIMWGGYEYYCVQCHYKTTSRSEFRNHSAEHSTVLQICQLCNYTTASKIQLARHKRKHKEDKKFKCHLCFYKARHNMSLIYHLKSHDGTHLKRAKKGFKCDRCGFKSDVKALVLKHVRLCSTNVKKFCCDKCIYETKRRSDLKRHKLRKHKEVDLEDEIDPNWE